LRNQLDAEFSTRGMLRSFVRFDELLDDWRQAIVRVEAELRIRLPQHCERSHAEVDAFLEPALRHQHRPVSDIGGADALSGWAQTVFTCFNALRTDLADQSVMQELDRIRTAFDGYTKVVR